jgi:methionyl-tRNA formyltransferase
VGLFTLEPESLSKMSGGIDLGQLACAARIPVMRGRNVNDPKAIEWIREKAPDVLLVVGWTQLVRPQLLAVPKIAALGFHASLLPKYRGRAPVNWAILNGESETGNTMIVLEPGADEGDIVSQRRIPITFEDDCSTIYQKVSDTECEMLDEVLPLIEQGRMPRLKQDPSQATVMPKRRPEDGIIDWSWTSRRIYDWVRALTEPYPGAFTHLSGRKITIWKASIVAARSHNPSGSIEFDTDGWPLVATPDGFLKLLQIECQGQPPCTGQEAAQTFLRPPASFRQSVSSKVAG